MISLDGVMQAPGGAQEDPSGGFQYGGWTTAYSDDLFSKMLADELKPADYILGRKTFEIWEGYWPKHNNFWPAINQGMKYVLSNTRDKSDWQNTQFINSVAGIEKLKQSEGNKLDVWGSSELVQLLLKHGLVDELRLKIYPLTLGKGKKLFNDAAMPGAFTLTQSQVNSKGVIIAHYKRGGAVETRDVEI